MYFFRGFFFSRRIFSSKNFFWGDFFSREQFSGGSFSGGSFPGVFSVNTVCFSCIPSLGLSRYIWTKSHTTFFYLIWSFFKKQNNILPATFLHDLWRNILLLLYSINWPNLIVWLLVFEINLIFLIKLFFLRDQKVFLGRWKSSFKSKF